MHTEGFVTLSVESGDSREKYIKHLEQELSERTIELINIAEKIEELNDLVIQLLEAKRK